MKPESLSAASFAGYSVPARDFAVSYLAVLQRLPLVICPSFLQQLQNLDTLFPAERATLTLHLTTLQQMPAAQFDALAAPLRALTVSAALQATDWVNKPAQFVTALTSFLWSSKQIDTFREATLRLFAAIPTPQDTRHRLVVVVVGQDADVSPDRFLRKLRRQGLYLNNVQHETAWDDIQHLAAAHAENASSPYDAWYVDGGTARAAWSEALRRGTSVSYEELQPVRRHILGRMQQGLNIADGDAEQMRTHLAGTTAHDADIFAVSSDPVLQRFYIELFTLSSGPQIFSTSFVQWTGRELARRAKPSTLVLRYAPRQRHQDMNALFSGTAAEIPDPQGSLRDAEMGAFYNWIEMDRITARGKLTFVAWAEGRPLAVVVGASAPQGVASASAMTLRQAVENFG